MKILTTKEKLEQAREDLIRDLDERYSKLFIIDINCGDKREEAYKVQDIIKDRIYRNNSILEDIGLDPDIDDDDLLDFAYQLEKLEEIFIDDLDLKNYTLEEDLVRARCDDEDEDSVEKIKEIEEAISENSENINKVSARQNQGFAILKKWEQAAR